MILTEQEYLWYSEMSTEEKKILLRRHLDKWDEEYKEFRRAADALGLSEEERVCLIKDQTEDIRIF